MRWMMYRWWWCEGDRAWWVFESVFLRSSDEGFWACLRDLPSDIPRPPEIWASLCNLKLKLRGNSHSFAILGSDSPQSNNKMGKIFKDETAYASACTDPGAALALLLSGRTRVRHWQSSRRLWPDTRRLQHPLDDCCRLVLPYIPCRTACSRRNRSLMTLPGWGRNVLLLAVIPVPRRWKG